MYPEHFGLSEPSFSITPDPHYLYLSREHREALAHLVYGASQSAGFVLLTGEVGTGKTTVCRAFLEQLPERVVVALVLNPALSATELLHTVCDEFGIQVTAKEASTKHLVDALNRFLLQAHAAGKRPVLMIDEAQNLKPDVLEQIRLLTNLETHKHKLLQIFLVGQPELRTMLQQKRLRQLEQRITARYHLLPLNIRETADYIAHRLAVAGVSRRVFTRGAIKRVFRFTKGVPRLINILCDRALLGAFAGNRHVVTAGIVGRAARELRGDRQRREGSAGWPALMAATLLAAGIGGLALNWEAFLADDPVSDAISADAEDPAQRQVELALTAAAPDTPPQQPMVGPAFPATADKPKPMPPVSTPEITPDPVPEPPANAQPPDQPLAEYLPATSLPADRPVTEIPAGDSAETGQLIIEQPPEETLIADNALIKSGLDRPTAMALLLRAWGIDDSPSDVQPGCELAEIRGLRCRSVSGGWQRLLSYNRPALLETTHQGGLLPLVGLDERQAEIDLGEQRLQLPLEQLAAIWNGNFLILWQPPPGGDMLIAMNSHGDIVRWLRQLLAQVPGLQVENPVSLEFDDALQEQVRQFQRQQGLIADGIAGPETLIRLNTLTGPVKPPRLRTDP